jgi:hypothetical protein
MASLYRSGREKTNPVLALRWLLSVLAAVLIGRLPETKDTQLDNV